jgi:hypothetical protein
MKHASVAAVVCVVSLAACTPMRSTIKPPYPLKSGMVGETELQQTAVARCEARPPNAFTTDGCSVWPDSKWRACCIEHDMTYWCGGGAEQRREADRDFRACVTERSNAFNAWLMYLGVRVGGWRLGPWPWRWGYGYDWPFKEENSRDLTQSPQSPQRSQSSDSE